MPEEGKKSGMMAQITVAVVVALCVGGSSPWWVKELFSPKPDPAPLVETGRAAEAKPAAKDQLANLDRSDLANRQEQLEKELAELRQEQKDNPQPRSVKNQVADVSGTWAAGGSSYKIYQNGTSLTIEEFTAAYGQTAIGEGSINGQDITLTIQTALGSQGTLSLKLSADGTSMSGTYTDHTFNSQSPYTLTR